MQDHGKKMEDLQAAFEHLRKDGRSLTASLVNFSDLDLSGIDFSGFHFMHSDFRRAILRGVNFSGSTLNNVDFCGADLQGADFTGAVIKDVDFTGADLQGVNFFRSTTRMTETWKAKTVKDVWIMGSLDGVSRPGQITTEEGRYKDRFFPKHLAVPYDDGKVRSAISDMRRNLMAAEQVSFLRKCKDFVVRLINKALGALHSLFIPCGITEMLETARHADDPSQTTTTTFVLSKDECDRILADLTAEAADFKELEQNGEDLFEQVRPASEAWAKAIAAAEADIKGIRDAFITVPKGHVYFYASCIVPPIDEAQKTCHNCKVFCLPYAESALLCDECLRYPVHKDLKDNWTASE